MRDQPRYHVQTNQEGHQTQIHPQVGAGFVRLHRGHILNDSVRQTIACFSAHSAIIPASASSPSVRAAGPGWRISVDLISRNQPVATAGTWVKPGRAATLAGTNFLPHQEPMMMSGAAAITSAPDTMRSLAVLRLLSWGNNSMPPAHSMSSDTQPSPEIIGSSHSSK